MEHSEVGIWAAILAAVVSLLGNGGLAAYLRGHAIKQQEHTDRIGALEKSLESEARARREESLQAQSARSACQEKMNQAILVLENRRLENESKLFDELRRSAEVTAALRATVGELTGTVKTLYLVLEKGGKE